MDAELAGLLMILVVWVLVGGAVLWYASAIILKKRVAFSRTVGAQALMVIVLPVWTWAYMLRFMWEIQTWDLTIGIALLLIGSLYQVWIIKRFLRTSISGALFCWVLNVMFTYPILVVSLPIPDLGEPRSMIARANFGMHNVGLALYDFFDRKTHLPVPWDERGKPVAGVPPSSGNKESTASAREEDLLYFRGPSYLPKDPLLLSGHDWVPADPFGEGDDGPYGYGAGPIAGPTAAFILTSRGPDKKSVAEDLEFLFLSRGRGQLRQDDPEFHAYTYSPTNGTVSPGDIFRVGTLRSRRK
jgi:hypothetical protein